MNGKRVSVRTAAVVLTLIATIVSLSSPWPAQADGVVVVDPPVCDPRCPGPVMIADQLDVRSHHVEVTITDQVATTRIDQVFHNPNAWSAEGTYLFPIPHGAAIGKFTMWVDGEAVDAKLLDAAEARRTYDDIVRRLRDPALLEYAGNGAVQARVFPIPPGEDRRIQIEYSEVLAANLGLTHYVYPLNTERFSAQPLEQVSVRVAVTSREAIRAVYSPSHDLAIDRPDDHHVVASYEASDVTPASDFELFYGVSQEAVGGHLISYYDREAGEGYFMLLAAPGIEDPGTTVIAKDVILVLDTSGSMEGEKITQAKQALTYVLDHLNQDDRFNIVAFSTGASVFKQSLQPASKAREAASWVERLPAAGGTDINLALLDAMGMVAAGRPAMVLFLTDGLPSEGEVEVPRILSNVAGAAPSNVRLFAFGVGDDVDTVLLDSLAQKHHGATTYVRPGQALDETVSTFYAGISTPVLTDLKLSVADVQVEDIYPTPLPDLFAGSQLVVIGRYRAGGKATVTLSGATNGQPQSFVYTDQTFATTGGDDFLPRLWATRKIGYLLDQIRLHGENAEWVSAVVDLSVRYGVVTPYTSYLITDEDVLTAAGRQAAAETASNSMAKAAAPSSGAAAVDQAQASRSMAEAQVAAAPSNQETGGSEFRVVGARTFILRDEVWIETTFDPSSMTPTRVPFASEAYFRLLEERPDLAAAFALGDRVIAVSGGTAYEVTPEAAASAD